MQFLYIHSVIQMSHFRQIFLEGDDWYVTAAPSSCTLSHYSDATTVISYLVNEGKRYVLNCKILPKSSWCNKPQGQEHLKAYRSKCMNLSSTVLTFHRFCPYTRLTDKTSLINSLIFPRATNVHFDTRKSGSNYTVTLLNAHSFFKKQKKKKKGNERAQLHILK